MQVFTIDLKKEYPFLHGGELQGLVMNNPYDWGAEPDWKRPAVIVVPGGGYAYASGREKMPIAHAFLAQGYQVFVLNYLCGDEHARYPEQLLEEAAAVDCIKKNADAWKVNKDEIFLVGFSAGGHLVANLAVEHQNVEEKAGVALDCKPTAVGLSYPVISSTHGHFGSYENLLKGYSEEEAQALRKKLNLDEAVSKQTPPAFIWTTATDAVVPADNAIRYALALDRNGISYELHVYPDGPHGLSTAHLDVNVKLTEVQKRATRWVEDCARFFRMFTVEEF